MCHWHVPLCMSCMRLSPSPHMAHMLHMPDLVTSVAAPPAPHVSTTHYTGHWPLYTNIEMSRSVIPGLISRAVVTAHHTWGWHLYFYTMAIGDLTKCWSMINKNTPSVIVTRHVSRVGVQGLGVMTDDGTLGGRSPLIRPSSLLVRGGSHTSS